MKATIYSITNPIGEVYIGSTKSKLGQRLNEHKYNIKRKRKGKIYDSFNLYGFEKHKVDIISLVDIDESYELEHFIIETFKPKLNITHKYNATATDKKWVNYKGKEFQVYKEDIKEYYNLGRIKKIKNYEL
jgi:group I intron endonuclease